MADTPGILLKSKRESKNLNIAQVAKATRIRTIYIQAMEADDFASLPSPVHARGFLRVYADFLDLESENLITKLAPDFLRPIDEKTSNRSEFEDSNKLDEGLPSTPEPSKGIVIDEKQNAASAHSDEFTAESDGQFHQSSSQNSAQSLITSSKLTSSKIFSSIGNKLRDQREALGLSLNEVEKHSRVLRRYLESIEAGEFENLPSSVQSRGMLTNYARFLEIDSDEILLLYADGLQAQLLERQKSETRKSGSANDSRKKISTLRRYISIDLLFGSGLIILLIIFAVWGTGKVIDLYNAPESLSSPASISDIILTPIQSATIEGVDEFIQTATLLPSTPGTDSPQILDIPANVQGQVQVYVVVLQRTWLRISVDNKISLEGRVEPGNAYSFNGNIQVQVLTGNGAALQIIYNQTDLGVMGVFGEIVDNIYTPNSIIKPTATITPTPTITPKPSLTPRTTSTQVP